MLDPADLVDSTLIPHTAFEDGKKRLEQCFKYAAKAAEPACIAVLGESRTGKSRLLEVCSQNHPMQRREEGLYVPILQVKTPSKPTVKGLAELMLHVMGDPRAHAGTESAKTYRLQKLMREAATRMVAIDEFQHFYDKTSRKIMHHVADWLKILADDTKVALVVAGLSSCRTVIDQNEQLAGRFQAPIFMVRFDWASQQHREEFAGIVVAFQKSIGQYFDMPRLDSEEMLFRCYCGTGGLMGYVTKLFRQAVRNAIDNKRKSISFDQLAVAHEQAIWQNSGIPKVPSPFKRNAILFPSDDLLAKIAKIGTPTEDVVMPIRTRRRSSQESVAAVLSAR